ncbi:T9SS type B sorting domain-containing protein, partial [Flavobacterium sp.]|uniref:T9SS type B sorting domain-containing protein n=2 Tax=Flavobacterium sp. TaxID=239 RepID=UPI0037C04D06
SFTIVQPDCTTSTGTITITTLANQYSFDNGLTWSTNPTSLPLNPGNYLLKIKDNTGCESNSSVAVVFPFTNPTPTFNAIPAFCAETTAPVLPTTSLNGIAGTWSPATVSNTTSGTYTFTPNAGQCGTITTISITVNPLVAPTFNTIPAFCAGTTAPVLPTTSLNGIVGTWLPATVSNTTSGTYTFTPNAGQCGTITTISITVNPLVTPTFNAIPAFCAGTTAPVLPTTSLNGIVGTWLPATVSNTTSGTYTFTPNAGQCGTITTISITVNPLVTPTFNAIPAFCAGTTAPVLPTTSLNGIVGTWLPATVSNTTSGTYTFTPNAGQCVTPTPVQITITVNPSVIPAFDPIPAFCAGTTAPVLPTTSLNGIVGTWSPANVSNTTSGTYTFTPNTGQCGAITTISITVNPLVTPTFNTIPAFCAGTTAPVLPTTSLNGIVGTWSPATVSNTTSGTYTFTPNAGQCASTQTIVTTINSSSLTDFQWIVSEPFSSNPTITIIPNSPGNYLYQLDSGTPQTSNVFYNVSSGLHTVQVTDTNGCSDTIVKNDILIIDYPRFFTPNADGYNDTWNINDLILQKNSKIYIYDRYGKLLKQIFPFQSGWDGKYNNNDMFSDDYWFVVEFEYNNTMKLFKAHFTLKR